MTELYEQLKQYGSVKHFDTGEDLLFEGDVARQLFLIETGGLRLWHNDDGREINVQFFFEHQMVSSFESYYLKQPSLFSITALEPTTVIVLDGDQLQTQMADSSVLLQQLLDYVCHRFISYTNYFLNRIQDSPEVRYQTLMQTELQLLERVPQHELASYLGITAVSLSRIRARLNKG